MGDSRSTYFSLLTGVFKYGSCGCICCKAGSFCLHCKLLSKDLQPKTHTGEELYLRNWRESCKLRWLLVACFI